MNDAQYIGYLKYSGPLVKNGYLDAKKAAEALVGFDETLRYFIENAFPELKGKSFEIPVRIQSGSWEALIPNTIGQWITTGLGVAFTAYLTGAASKLAENDFKNKHIADVFRDALKMLQWIIRITAHLKGVSIKTIKNIRWENNNETVLIPDVNGKYIKIPRKILQKYMEISPKILSKMIRLVQAEREMSIGVIENGKREEVKVSVSEKNYFASEDNDLPETIFPELVHGQSIELEGEITKGNEKTNSLGLEYQGYILTCYPKEGSIVAFKHTLFRKCKISGVINRIAESGLSNSKKPGIIFATITPVDKETVNQKFLWR